MELYRLVVVNLLFWGIPSIPTYFTYKVTQPFVKDLPSLVFQLIAVVLVFLVILIANHETFWNNYYHKYMTEIIIKEEKEKKKFV